MRAVRQISEKIFIQAFVSEFPVKTLNTPALIPFSWLNVILSYLFRLAPF
jgi:hypothetical protein